MIKKIISGGQTGVDRAALDAAIKLGIDHGGWIPKGRLTESGPLPPEYHLKETRSASYADRTEQNVLEGDGTLILSRGPLTGGSDYTREMAFKHGRPWLHVDLNRTAAFQAAVAIHNWISAEGIQILNVAGPRASKDPKIYRDTIDILESAYYLGLVESGKSGAGAARNPMREPGHRPGPSPQNMEEAVERLLDQMPMKDKTTVANMLAEELPNLYLTLGGYIMNSFGLLSGNTKLLDSCRQAADGAIEHEEDAVAVIIRALWQKLQQTHKLRVVK